MAKKYDGSEYSTMMVLNYSVEKALLEAEYTEDGFPVSGDAVAKEHRAITGFTVAEGGVLWV